jgi:hypothetical protein
MIMKDFNILQHFIYAVFLPKTARFAKCLAALLALWASVAAPCESLALKPGFR